MPESETEPRNEFVKSIRNLITEYKRLETEQEIIAARKHAEKEIFSDG